MICYRMLRACLSPYENDDAGSDLGVLSVRDTFEEKYFKLYSSLFTELKA